MDAPTVANLIAVVSVIVAGVSVYAAVSSRNEARRSRGIAEEALANSRISTEMAARSAKTAEETRHDAIAPTFQYTYGFNRSLEVFWVRIELLTAASPIQVKVKVTGTAILADRSGYDASTEESRDRLLPGDDFDFALPYPEGAELAGIIADVEVLSIRKRDYWIDIGVIPWESSKKVRWGYDPERDP